LKYKLKAYQKTFPDFICNSPTSTKVLNQNEETEARLSGTVQEEECRLRNHRISKVEQFRRRRYKQKNHRTLEEGVRKRKNHREFKNKDKWKLFQQ
jgi:hypothetical protein